MQISSTSPETSLNPKNTMDASALAIKVRKPYTITKQRERWTDQEHAKFLEALKLYGRAWRQIEEHIGTKSAIQIRSHAQKFFTKVVRESDDVKSIVIPPPRPKKKPSKPYPRKLGNLPKVQLTLKPEWPAVSKLPTYDQEQDNFSPTSIITAIESDTFGSSSATHVETLSNEKENDAQSATTSVDNHNNSLALHTSDMELDLASSTEAPVTSLKLFGKLLTVADSQKSLSSNMNSMPCVCGVSENTPESSPREECCLNDDQNDGSFTDSHNVEINNNNVGAQDNIVFEVPRFKLVHSGRSAFRTFEMISNNNNNAKGFVPYRR